MQVEQLRPDIELCRHIAVPLNLLDIRKRLGAIHFNGYRCEFRVVNHRKLEHLTPGLPKVIRFRRIDCSRVTRSGKNLSR